MSSNGLKAIPPNLAAFKVASAIGLMIRDVRKQCELAEKDLLEREKTAIDLIKANPDSPESFKQGLIDGTRLITKSLTCMLKMTCEAEVSAIEHDAQLAIEAVQSGTVPMFQAERVLH